MNMTKYLIIILAVQAGYAHGFDFADFVNDFHSDLAPLLTLFGEKVTMQYISQAMGPLDCIALALAPLGIITIMVSAIRVGGPTVLKAIVGRAKENIAAAELELMSSTSREVCELFNGENIVRCLGSGSVWQYICLFQKGTGNGQVKFMSLQDATDNGLLIETHGKADKKAEEDARSPQDRNREGESPGSATGIALTKQITMQRIRRRLWKSGPRETDTETCPELGLSHTAQQPAQNSATVIVVYDDVPEAPNISLNLQHVGSQQTIWVAVILGFFVQTAVLVFFCLIQFNPKVQTLLKIKEPLPPYGFHMALGGTVFMAIGMFLCVDVVEKSTSEKVYQANDQFDMRLYWLQQNQTVNDQVFQSFATFPDRCCTRFLKSHRAGTSQDRQTAKKLQTNTCLGVALGLVGFVGQFIGFRGFHPAAPLAQLLAIITMTVCRAMVRPGFTKDFGTAKLLHGFEQDWLTQELAQHLAQQLPQSMDDGNKQRHGVAPWRIVTGRDVDYRAFETLVACKKSQTPNQAPGSEAQRLLVMRKGFYGKARTRTLSSKCAAQLAIAMEKALGILFPDGPGCQGGLGFRWVIDVAVKGATQLVWIDLSYKEDTLRWKVEADDLHAVLSLWVHAAWAQRNEPRPDDGHAEADDGTWICGDVCEPSLKALGCRNYRLRHQVMKDLETWATQSRYILAEIMEIWKVEVERQKKEERKKKKEEKKKKKEEEGEQKKEGNRGLETNCARAVDRRVESQDSIVGLYASDILFSFMWSMAKTLRVRLGREDKRIQTIGPQETKPWGNTTMTDLISAFREASHWSEHETCLGVISPLSILGKLPIQPWFHTMSEAIMDARRSKDRALIRAATSQAIQKAQSLVFTYKAGTSGLRERGLVWLQEQQRGAMYVPFGFESGTIFLETPMGYLFDESNSRLFDQVRWKGAFFEALEKLWEIQCNTKTFTNRKRLPAHFDFTALHGEAARGNKIGSDAPAELKALVNVQDVTGWTPIFYACAAKNSEMVRQLFDLGADATLADIHGYTVAHHACLSGCEETLTILASQRVDLEAQAINGAKPIHLAAGKGRDDVITHLDRLEQMYPGTRRREAVHLDFDNRTPMHWAAAGGHVQVLKALKGDVNVQDDRGWSSLHIAILAGRKHTISTLHQLSADVERRDFKGRTPLILACAEKRWEVVGELIDIGAKVDAADSNDMTPLHYLVTKGAEGDDAAEGDHAAKRDSSTMIPILTKGLDGQAIKHLTELRNRDGHTPLQLAAMKGGLDTINKLLELGADADLANSRGESPLFLALTHAKKDKVAFRIAKALVRGENSLRVKSVDGRSLLDVARSRQFSNVVSFLEAERERLERDSLCWKDDWHARDRCKDEEVLFLASAHCSCRSPAAERTLR